jgi:hypothetical protein
MPMDPFQARVAQVALHAAAGRTFALAGGNALIAHGLLTRPTQDVDLFTPEAGGAAAVLEAVRGALVGDGFTVDVTRGPTGHNGDFAQLRVSRDDLVTQVDLGRDWRAREAVTLDIGPVLHLDDAVAAKATALLGRALARDFIDVAAALDRYSRSRLLQLAFERDPGLRVLDVAFAAQRLDRLPDDQFLHYALSPDQVLNMRARYTDWPRDSTIDQIAQETHDRVHGTDQSPAQRARAAYPQPLTQALQHPAPPPAQPTARGPRLGDPPPGRRM